MNYTSALRKRRKKRLAAAECSDCGENSPLTKQKLSPAAAKKKAIRDKKYAMSKWGKFKKRTAQAAKCKKGYDFDHSIGKNGKCVPKSENRARNSRSGKVQSKYKGKQ
tara:strand:- start:415 stop:738 length:324 start_codon:yes stop_codon:yes gene_type:complete